MAQGNCDSKPVPVLDMVMVSACQHMLTYLLRSHHCMCRDIARAG